MNRKKIQRLCREKGLSVRCQRGRNTTEMRARILTATTPKACW